MSGDRDIKIDDGNYNERVEKNVIHAQQVTIYEQSGNFGAGHVSESEIKEEAKLGGIINEGKEKLKTTQQEICQKTTTKKRLAFAIAGSIEEVDQAKLKAIAAVLRTITGDASIEIVDMEEGSIRLILEGSQEGLEKLKELFESGELTEVDDIPVEYVRFLDTEKLDDDENIEAYEKPHTVQKIVNQDAKDQELIDTELNITDRGRTTINRGRTTIMSGLSMLISGLSMLISGLTCIVNSSNITYNIKDAFYTLGFSDTNVLSATNIHEIIILIALILFCVGLLIMLIGVTKLTGQKTTPYY